MINFLKLILAIVGFAFLAEVSFGQGDAPPILKGLNQADKSIGAFIRTPNGQATKISSSSALIETGNNNILENPSFEHSIYDTSWVINSGSSSKIDVNTDSTKVVHGLNALKMTMAASPLDILNVSPTSNQSFKDGVQGLISVRVKTSVSGVKVCQRVGFSTNFNNCVNVTANGKWGLYKVPSILGEFYNGIVVTSQGVSITGDVYIDDAFVGPVDLKQDLGTTSVQTSSIQQTATFGQVTITGALTTTSGSGNYSYNSATGIYTALKSGVVYVSATLMAAGAASVTANITKNSTALSGDTSGPSSTFVASASTEFDVIAGDTFKVSNASANSTSSQQITVAFLNFVQTSTYSSTNSDTDWAPCTPSSSQGFGTPTFAVQCKRQGGDLLMKGRFTPSATTAVEARIGLPVWNGTQLVSAGSTVIPALEVANGVYVRAITSTAHGGAVLIEPSVSYITFGPADTFNTVSTVPLSKALANAIASTDTLSFNARIPIEGWQNSNIIIGQFNGLESCSSTLNCTDTFSAKVSATGVVTDENVDWISGNASVASATFTMTYNTGIFTVAPNCVVSSSTASSAALSTIAHLENNPTSTQVVVETGSPADAAYDFNIVCQKQGVDYIGKTAKAVASDQNLRSPGVTNSVLCSAKISATGVISDQQGGCFASCTNATTPVCTFTTNYWVGIPNCWVNSTSVGFNGDASATSTTLAGTIYNTAFNAVATSRNYICHGIKQ